MVCNGKQASFTVEASILMPFLSMLLVLLFQIALYLHDMSVFVSVAYEAAQKGAELVIGEEGERELYVESFVERRLQECVLVCGSYNVEANVTREKVQVLIKGAIDIFASWNVEVKKEAFCTNEVDDLRRWKKIKSLGMAGA